jgi:hypothetical protein
MFKDRSEIHDLLHQHHMALSDQDKQLDELLNQVEESMTGLEELAAKGPGVSPEEVITFASQMIGRGADPAQVGGMLADMPGNPGQALGAWVQQKLGQSQQNYQQLVGMQQLMKHEKALAGLHVLAGHDVHGGQELVGPGPEGAGPDGPQGMTSQDIITPPPSAQPSPAMGLLGAQTNG